MSLNKFMHPRNKYKNKKPDFKELASKYPEFEEHTTSDSNGKVHLDFKDPKALRVLTKTLLEHDFQLKVDLPPDRLVPTIPLRLNYIHWIEDILGKTEAGVKGIDVGTGCSCVYPLLGCRLNNWSFLATEIDAQNVHYAEKNVQNNHLEDKIKVRKMSKGDILLAAVNDSNEYFHFCMCNPPFFADHMEAQAITTSRNIDRADPFSVSTASPEESISQGGEITFVSQMIDESKELKERIHVFTSMIGKKSSLPQLKEKLRLTQGAKFASTEFCQGKTMRWGIAWTFDDSVSFPKSLFHTAKKDKPPLSYTIPFGAATCLYETADLTQYITSLLCELQIKYKERKPDALHSSWFITAKEKSWQNQRRKRRKIQRDTDPQEKTETFKPVSELKITKDDDKFNTEVEEKGSHKITEHVCKLVSDRDCESPDTDNRKKNNSKEIVNTTENIKKRKIEVADSDHVKRVCVKTEDFENNSTEIVNNDEQTGKRKSETTDCDQQVKRVCINNDDPESKKCENDLITATNAGEVENSTEVVNMVENVRKRKSEMVNTDQKEKHVYINTEDSESKNCINDFVTIDSNQNIRVPVNTDSESKKSETDPVSSTNAVVKSVSPSNGVKIPGKEKDCNYVLKCYINLKKVEKTFVLELVWVDGESREVLHQLMQFFKNKLQAPDA